MDDLIHALIILSFFALAWGFVRLCDRLWGGTTVLSFEIVAAALAAALAAYLLLALLHPERFQ